MEVLRRAADIHFTCIPVVHATDGKSESSNDNTVWHRLKRFVSTNEYGAFTPGMVHIMSVTQFGVLFGGVMGGLIYSKNHYMHFMENASASTFKHHMDAKNALTKQMVGGALKGTYYWAIKSVAVTTTYALLLNVIPVLRDEKGWLEHVTSGLVSGTLAGHLFSNREQLGFEPKKHKGRYSYKTTCLMRGVKYGWLLGFATGLNSYFSTGDLNSDLKKLEAYWNQRRQVNNESTSEKPR